MFSNQPQSAIPRVGLKDSYIPPAKMHVWLLLGDKNDYQISARPVAASERWQRPSGVSDRTCWVSIRLVDKNLYSCADAGIVCPRNSKKNCTKKLFVARPLSLGFKRESMGYLE